MCNGYLTCNQYTDTLDTLIVALCRDFGRREDAVLRGSCSKRTAMEYKYINHRLLDAANEIAGRDGCIYINEIGKRLGYAYTAIEYISESSYKKIKKEVKINIAKKLHLID